MSDDKQSNMSIVVVCVTAGAALGFLLQVALGIWAAVAYGAPGLFEVIAMFVIAIVVAVAGGAVGAVIGVILKLLKR